MKDVTHHQKYMWRCLQLASLAEGNTYPNPLVGSVIVHQGKIIGEGYHCKAGEAHAEINAINAVKDKRLLAESTLYVNLEPCAHYGKTPPCSLAIIKYKIPEVVVGCVDTFSEVAGKGIDMMKKEGIQVMTGVLEKESRQLNRRFFTFHEKKRPFVILKWAQSMDGFIDIDRTESEFGQPTWITNEWARRAVHRQRSVEQAILVGTQTALKDNPSLTVRNWQGKQPCRVLIDRRLRLPSSIQLYTDEGPTIILNELKEEKQGHIRFIKVDLQENVATNVLSALYKQGFQSLIVEGGKKTLEFFIRAWLWDEAHVFVGDVAFTSGIAAPALQGEMGLKKDYGNSKLFIYRNIL